MDIDVKKMDLLIANKCLSYREFSELSKVDTVTISRIRNGSQRARPQTIGKFAKALEVKVEDLIKIDNVKGV